MCPGQVELLVGAAEPFAVRAAARALADDLEDALGQRPAIAATGDNSADTTSVSIWIESDRANARALGLDSAFDGPETFLIRAVQQENRHGLLISGADPRGAIYGVFHLAHAHVGAEPFKWFTGNKAPHREQIDLTNVDFTSATPPIRFRGWHVEGVNTLEHWRQPGQTHNPYWLYWDWILETLLRCGGNMVKPNTNNPRSPEVSRAQQWGLLITQEHATPFGVGMWEIGSDIPKVPGGSEFNANYDDFPEVFEAAWQDGLRAYPNPKEVIWTLAHRGRGDKPFWEVDPERYPTDEKRGEVITRVLQRQADMVREALPDAAPVFIHNTWMEGNRLYKQGHTRVPDDTPENTIVVWADNGYGTFRAMIAEGCEPSQILDGLPDEPVRPGTHGVYYHVSMWDFNTPYVTQFVPPRRMHEQFSKALEKGASGYLLVNVGRVRDAITGAAAIADIWNHPQHWQGPVGTRSVDGGNDFLKRWAQQHYSDQAEQVLECYEALFDTPIKWGQWGGWDDYILGDVGHVRLAGLFVTQTVSHAVRQRYESITVKFWDFQERPLAEQMTLIQQRAADVAPKWEAAVRKAESIHEQLQGAARDFFVTDVLSQLRVNQCLSQFLLRVIDAVQAYEVGDFTETASQARQARDQVDNVERTLREREYGPWQGWNTPALLRFACVPMARFHCETLIEVAERLGTRKPTAF